MEPSTPTFTQLIVLALLLEACVQTLKPIWEPSKRTKEFYLSLLVGLALSTLVNYLAGLDLFTAFGLPLSRLPAVGTILTGIILSRGAGTLHDLFKTLSLATVAGQPLTGGRVDWQSTKEPPQ